MYQKEFELFSEKLTFACEVLPLVEKGKMVEMVGNGFVGEMIKGLVRLAGSRNSKNRGRAVGVVKSMLDCWEEEEEGMGEKGVTKEDLMFAKEILKVIRAQLSEFKESRMQLNSLTMLRRVFSSVLRSPKSFHKSY